MEKHLQSKRIKIACLLLLGSLFGVRYASYSSFENHSDSTTIPLSGPSVGIMHEYFISRFVWDRFVICCIFFLVVGLGVLQIVFSNTSSLLVFGPGLALVCGGFIMCVLYLRKNLVE